jgi:hypothetical protein
MLRPQPPSPVHEGSEEGSSPRASVSDNGNLNASDFTPEYLLDQHVNSKKNLFFFFFFFLCVCFSLKDFVYM